MHVINNSCFMERVHLEVWTTKRRENLTLKDEGYLFKVARWASVATKSKIGSCKSAGDYSELPWINRHMSISEWEAHCLLLHFSASYVIQFYMLDNCMLFFLSLEWSWKKYLLSSLGLWNSKILWKFKASICCCAMDHVFCYILHWVLWNNLISCFLKFIFGKVLLFLVDYMTIKALCQKL